MTCRWASKQHGMSELSCSAPWRSLNWCHLGPCLHEVVRKRYKAALLRMQMPSCAGFVRQRQMFKALFEPEVVPLIEGTMPKAGQSWTLIVFVCSARTEQTLCFGLVTAIERTTAAPGVLEAGGGTELTEPARGNAAMLLPSALQLVAAAPGRGPARTGLDTLVPAQAAAAPQWAAVPRPDTISAVPTQTVRTAQVPHLPRREMYCLPSGPESV